MMMQFSFHVEGRDACSFLLLTVYPELEKQRIKSLQNDWTFFFFFLSVWVTSIYVVT